MSAEVWHVSMTRAFISHERWSITCEHDWSLYKSWALRVWHNCIESEQNAKPEWIIKSQREGVHFNNISQKLKWWILYTYIVFIQFLTFFFTLAAAAAAVSAVSAIFSISAIFTAAVYLCCSCLSLLQLSASAANTSASCSRFELFRLFELRDVTGNWDN